MKSDSKGINPKEKSHLLHDHKQVGKRFIPPLSQLGMEDVYWVNDILPELLWLALLNEEFGWARGAHLGLELAKAASGITRKRKKPWFARTSAYGDLTEKQRMRIVKKLGENDVLLDLQNGLSTLVHFYPECPFRFLYGDKPKRINEATQEIQFFKSTLESLFDRREIPATHCQSNSIYIAFVTGKLLVSKGLVLADFPEIENFPNTEKSRLIASLIRATVTGFFGNDFQKGKSLWLAYFWNRGLEIEGCNFFV